MEEDTLATSNVRMVFLPIEQTFNQDATDLSKNFMYRTVDMKRFGLKDLTVESFARLKETIANDRNLLLRYLVLKRGFNPDDPGQYEAVIKLYEDFDIIDPNDNGEKFICQISANLVPGELEACLNDVKQSGR